MMKNDFDVRTVSVRPSACRTALLYFKKVFLIIFSKKYFKMHTSNFLLTYYSWNYSHAFQLSAFWCFRSCAEDGFFRTVNIMSVNVHAYKQSFDKII